MIRNKEERTGTSFFFDEFVDENRNSKRVNSLGGDEKVVVIVNDEAEKDESRHAGNDGEKSLHLWGLSPHPCRDGVDRRSLRSHGVADSNPNPNPPNTNTHNQRWIGTN